MKCPKCEKELIWEDDNDYGAEGEGIVSNNSCPNDECYVDMVIIYTEIEQ